MEQFVSLVGLVCMLISAPLIEGRQTTPPPTTPYTPPDHVEGTCPGKAWLPYGAFCYFFCDDDNPPCQRYATWQEANEACKALGGTNFSSTLASIHDEAENYWVWSRVLSAGSYDGWIGLYRDEVGGEYLWTNGDAKVYEAWLDGEPLVDEYLCSRMSLIQPGWASSNCTVYSYEPYTPVCKTKKHVGGGDGAATTISITASCLLFYVVLFVLGIIID